MHVLVYGAGNLILSDEGFGVHFVKYLQRSHQIPKDVELLTAARSASWPADAFSSCRLEAALVVDELKSIGVVLRPAARR